jgi:hypothetical protein
MARLNINPKFSHHLFLQPAEENPDSPKMAYLIRQLLENKLRQQIDKWHNMSFSPLITQKIQCQLEINQDFFDWSDSTDITRSLNNSHCPSPALSTHSACSNKTNPTPWFPFAASASSCKPSLSKKSHPVKQLQVVKPVPMCHPPITKTKQTTNSLKSKSGMKNFNINIYFFKLLFQFMESDNHHQIYQIFQQNGFGQIK